LKIAVICGQKGLLPPFRDIRFVRFFWATLVDGEPAPSTPKKAVLIVTQPM